MIALLALVAWAGPQPDMHLFGSVGDEGPGLGAGFGASWPVGPIRIEGAADIGAVGPIGLEVHGWTFARWFPGGDDLVVAPSFRAGPGIRIAERSVAPEALLGAAADLPRLGPLRPRIGVDGIYRVGGPLVGRLSIGFVTARPADPVDVPAPFEDPSGKARVWMPHPVCQWVPADEVDAWVGLVPPGEPLKVKAPGYVPVEAPVADLAAVKLEPAPEHGSVIVVATAGDHVRVGDSWFDAPADGVVVLDLPVGIVSIEVWNDRRREVLEAAVADGYAVWVRSSWAVPMEAP